jgi:hypothetical protein
VKKRRVVTWFWRCVAAVSLLAVVWVGYVCARSYRQIDQYRWQWMGFDSTPRNAPPPQAELTPRPPKVYPPGTVSYKGEYHNWSADSFKGRLLLRFSVVSSYYESREPTPELKRLLGWRHTVERIDYWIIYNVPRGNVWISWREWHWNGVATWDTFMDGDSARLVMLPYWLLMIVAGTPGALWLVVVGWKRWRRKAGHCRGCGYNLAGVRGVCPECGAAS